MNSTICTFTGAKKIPGAPNTWWTDYRNSKKSQKKKIVPPQSHNKIKLFSYAMEAHVVTWNRKYKSFENCLNQKDGLCVLAFMFLVSISDSKLTVDPNLLKDQWCQAHVWGDQKNHRNSRGQNHRSIAKCHRTLYRGDNTFRWFTIFWNFFQIELIDISVR